MSGNKKLRVGSRKSELALIQTRHVIARLQEIHPDTEFEIVTMNTLGDQILDKPLPKIGEKSLFTKELETALANGNVDFLVHSLKDLPTVLPDGMAIGAVLEREDPRDALVLQKDLKDLNLQTLPKGSVIGTSSLRRTAQLSRKYPHLKVEDIRGNLNTRLRKLDELGKFHAIILAAAGLNRMGWDDRITKILESEEILYAVGQGALAVECRENDTATVNLLHVLYDPKTCLRVITERTFLQTLGGGCSAPVAISTELTNVQESKHNLKVVGAVWSLDGKDELTDTIEISLDLKKSEQCSTCPYKGHNEITKNDNESSLNSNDDCCLDKPSKRLKVNHSEPNRDIPNELLKSDPHEHCPISLPVGADFMGKCPYLETNANMNINVNIENPGSSIDNLKCPFLKNNESIENSTEKTSNDNDKLYCGLVPHNKLPAKAMEDAKKLGKDLAQNLINKGALNVMAKAQHYIRNS